MPRERVDVSDPVSAGQRHPHRRDVGRIEPEADLCEPGERLAQQTRADEQGERDRQLAHDEDVLGSPTAVAFPADAFSGQMCRRLSISCEDDRHQRAERRHDEHEAHREEQNGSVEADLVQPWHVERTNTEDESPDGDAQREAAGNADRDEQQMFRQQQTGDARARRSERQTDRNLLAPHDLPADQQVRDGQACDHQHQPRCAPQHQERRLYVPEDRLGERHHPRRQVRVGGRIVVAERRHDLLQLVLGRLTRDAGRETADAAPRANPRSDQCLCA